MSARTDLRSASPMVWTSDNRGTAFRRPEVSPPGAETVPEWLRSSGLRPQMGHDESRGFGLGCESATPVCSSPIHIHPISRGWPRSAANSIISSSSRSASQTNAQTGRSSFRAVRYRAEHDRQTEEQRQKMWLGREAHQHPRDAVANIGIAGRFQHRTQACAGRGDVAAGQFEPRAFPPCVAI